MSHADMLKYRDVNATAKTREGQVFGPWVDNFVGMAQKTCLRQLAKWMPKSTELAAAMAVDEGFRVDLRATTDPAEATEHPPVIEGEVEDAPPAQNGETPAGAQ